MERVKALAVSSCNSKLITHNSKLIISAFMNFIQSAVEGSACLDSLGGDDLILSR